MYCSNAHEKQKLWPLKKSNSPHLQYCCYNFNPYGMTSFTPIFNQELEQGKSMVAVYSWK